MSDDLTHYMQAVSRYRDALVEIRDADPVDMALDPGWPARIAATALASRETHAPEEGTDA